MPSARPSCRTSLLVHWNVWMRFPIAPADHPVVQANRVVHTMYAGAKHVPRAVSVSSGCGVTSIPHSATNGFSTVGRTVVAGGVTEVSACHAVGVACLFPKVLRPYVAFRLHGAPRHGRMCHNTPLGCMKQE